MTRNRPRHPRPVPAGVPYHRVLAGEKRRIGRGILAIALLNLGLAAFTALFAQLSALVDGLLGRDSIVTGGTELTPAAMAATFGAVALLIPWSMLLQRWLYGVRGASLHSVVSAFRPAALGRAVLVLVPVWVVYVTAFTALQPYQQTSRTPLDLMLMFAIVLLVVPLQSAGEEYGFRGLVFRVAASWGRGPRTALVLGTLTSAVLFATIHLSTDLWLNLYYVALGVSWSLITWRTGGIETAVVLHASSNVFAFLLAIVLQSDLSTDRASGAGSVIYLIPIALNAAVAAVVWYRTRHSGPAVTPEDVTADDAGTRAVPVPAA
ncbi:CPBP family intramembrane metalloprotease [Promicromonospora sukumoe]|uniref:Membrane protease YdiL (CAAX protease family) n=1 Tax=Promicromonospora sukumoe TaxID=88382 RepID=A0A7W3PD55_9MICO|nr:type II CAAX endopeptidase family protein [Promicromonospora sukumoe]MBA8807207.1 membrane protease YdiL (CAAX protease family) [Promicromonospora sukumoe]